MAAAGDEDGLIRLYRNSTQLVALIATPAAVMLAVFAEEILWAWTGNANIARHAAPVLTLYALGNGVLALAAFPYYLQYAKGDLKLHLAGNALFVVILIPSLVWATWHYGMTGAGYAWLGSNVLYFLVWVPKVHARFVSGLHFRWLSQDISLIVCVTAAAALLLRRIFVWPHERALIAFDLIFFGLVLLALAAACSTFIRSAIVRKLRSKGAKEGVGSAW